jgi:hypothetical protein
VWRESTHIRKGRWKILKRGYRTNHFSPTLLGRTVMRHA